MTELAARRPLIGALLPAEGALRLSALAGFAVLGSLILWASAKVSVPFYPVPMTLQTLAVMMLAASYGWRLGLATVLLYLAEGASGLPVFTGTPEKGLGLPYMLGPTGGYLLGFGLATVVVGWLAERGSDRHPLRLFGAMVLGDAIVFAAGLAWLGVVIGWNKPLLSLGLYPFLLGDAVKLALAACLVAVGRRTLKR